MQESLPFSFLPHQLTVEEYQDPYLAIDHFFDFNTFTGSREELKSMLHQVLSANRAIDLHDPSDILLFFEHLEKLVEAAYLIHLRQK